MTFLAPGYLLAAGLAALGVIALHLLSTREPQLETLPTTRFIPESPLQAFSLAFRPSDLWLLVLRVLIILLLGAALARPVWERGRVPVARIVALDISRAVGNPAELADSAQRYLDDAAAVILFADTVREVPPSTAADSLALSLAARSGTAAGRPGSLSAALIAAQRAAARLRDRADSLELVLVSAFAAEQYDAATGLVRALWPGGIHLVSVGIASPAAQISGEGAPPEIRVVWADSGGAAGWRRLPEPDTVGGVRAGDVVLVYPFVRGWEWTGGEGMNAGATSASAVVAGGAGAASAIAGEGGATASHSTERIGVRQRPGAAPVRIYARWLDGSPAAVEWQDDAGCTRSLGFALPTAGDALLRPEFQRFLDALEAPCGETPDLAPLPAELLAELAGPAGHAPTERLARAEVVATPLMPWFLGAALALACVELIARRRRRRWV